MIDRQTLAYLRLLHGSYNAFVMFLFFYQGLLGLRIRKDRKTGGRATKSIKRHRKMGPVIAVLGVAGFLAGVVLVYIDKGHLLEYPLHFLTGLSIALSITATFFVSRKIKGIELPWRVLHFRLGILIVSLYSIQIFLGLGILF